MRPVEPEPWALGVRLRDEPEGVHRFVVRAGAPADGRRIADLERVAGRHLDQLRRPRPRTRDIRGETELHSGDRVLVLGDEDCADKLKEVFEGTARE